MDKIIVVDNHEWGLIDDIGIYKAIDKFVVDYDTFSDITGPYFGTGFLGRVVADKVYEAVYLFTTADSIQKFSEYMLNLKKEGLVASTIHMPYGGIGDEAEITLSAGGCLM